MRRNHTATIDITKSLAGIPFTVLAAIGAASGNLFSLKIMSAKALGQVGRDNPIVANALLKNFPFPPSNSFFRLGEAVAVALGRVGQDNPEVVEVSLKSLADSSFISRCTAAKTLGQLGKGDLIVIETLLQKLRDPYYVVRRAAAEALGQVGQGNPQVIEALLNSLSDFETEVRRSVAKSLKALKANEVAFCSQVEKLLEYNDFNSDKPLIVDESIDAWLFALQLAVRDE